MWPDRVSSPGPLTYESGALPIALRGPASLEFESRVSVSFVLAYSRNGYIQRQNSHSYSTQTRVSIAQVWLEWD